MTVPLDLSPLLGSEVTLICFAEFSCYVHLENGVHMRIESAAVLFSDAGEQEVFPKPHPDAISRILGKTVLKVSMDGDSLILDLQGNSRLVVRCDVGYESFSIEAGVP